MRILAFGDVHMSAQQCRRLPDAGKADLILVTGDLTNFGRKPDARIVLDELLSVNSRLLGVIGNLDHYEINDYLEHLEMNLHGQARIVDKKIHVMGAGGSNITPFRTPTEFSENEITEILMRGYRQTEEFRSLAPFSKYQLPTILVSHVPPRNTRVDRLTNGQHVGSTAVRAFIETYQPEICLTGHIHEARGEDRIGKTHIINPGMFHKGGWVEITLNHTTLTAILK